MRIRRPTWSWRKCSLVGIFCFLNGIVAQAQSLSFQGLGFLPGPYKYTFPSAISKDGQVVVGWGVVSASYDTVAFRWTAEEGMAQLPFPVSSDLSADGSVVIGYVLTGPSAYEAIRWSSEAGIEPLGFLGNGDTSVAEAVSGDGSVIVGESNSVAGGYPLGPFVWKTSTGMFPIDPLSHLESFSTSCFAVSADGSTAVGDGPNAMGKNEAYYWREDTGTVAIGADPSEKSSAYAVSNDGAVVAGVQHPPSGPCNSPFRWTSATGMLLIGNCGGPAYAISGDGELIGGLNVYAGGPDDAAIWDPQHSWRNVHQMLEDAGVHSADGWYLEAAYRVSSDGQTWLGYGYDPLGYSQAWLAFIPRPSPCPADVNGDRIVDLADIAAMLVGYGSTPSLSTYSLALDIDRNGVIDLGDLAGVLGKYGVMCP